MDLRYMATILMDSNKVVVLDIRSPAMPVAELQRHRANVKAITWAPQTARRICSAGDDGQALIWELPTAAGAGGAAGGPAAAAVFLVQTPDGIDPALACSAGVEINQLQWSAGQPDWIGIVFANKVQLLRV